MLSSRAGQMLRYMLLWDCEKSGYTRYQFVTVGDNCEECSSLDGQVFDIKDAKCGINLAPIHSNCDCGAAVLDKNGGVVVMVGGKESKQNNQNTYNGIFAPMLRIPKDAAKMLKSYYNAQIERAQKIKNPLSFLDWVTMGIVSGAWQGMQQRTDKMLENPTVYNVGNWLTMGLLDTAKGAINPDEPLSLEHWLDSAELAGTVVGGYEFGRTEIVKKVPFKTYSQKNNIIKKENVEENFLNDFPNAYELSYSKTVQKHFYEPIKKGKNKGESSRPYLDPKHSNLIVDEIISSGDHRKDFILTNGYRWDVHGRFNGAEGTWELVIDIDTKKIVHFNFVTDK